MWMLCFYENSRNQYCFFKLKFFSLFFFFRCFLYVHYFSFALSSIIRATKWPRTHNNQASNINKIINYNCEIIEKIKIWPHIEFPENNFELSRSHSFQLQHKRKLLHHLSTFTLSKLRPLCGDTHWSD